MSEPRKHPLIRNCRFAFRCHQKWDWLENTANARVRYCHECSRQVVLCRSDAQLRSALEADECIAIEGASPGDWLIGDVVPKPPKK